MNNLSKQQCKGHNWGNKKEITNSQIAQCVVDYSLNIECVPASRLEAVSKQVHKLKKQQEKVKACELIECELAMYVVIDDGSLLGKTTDKFIGYSLDPDLFHTHWEAVEAMSILSSMFESETTKRDEHGYKDKDANRYSRLVADMRTAMLKVRTCYIELGGQRSAFDKAISQIPKLEVKTLKQGINMERDFIEQYFISLGTSKTRANKIAIAITTDIYYSLK